MGNRFNCIAMVLIAAGSALSTGSAAAQQPPRDMIVFSWAAGADVHHQSYREPSLDVSEDGWFGGLTGDLRLTYNQWQLRGEALLAYGKMDYSGSGTINGIDDVELELRLLGAYALPLNTKGDQLTPYAGYGYRLLADFMGGHTSSTGRFGYDRLSQYHYIPIGLESLVGIAPGWALKPTIEYDYFIEGTQDSYLSPELHNTQNSGYGARASLFARTSYGSNPIEFGPFVRYWHIDQSNTQTAANSQFVITGFEPQNHTVEAGLGFKFWF